MATKATPFSPKTQLKGTKKAEARKYRAALIFVELKEGERSGVHENINLSFV